MTLRRGGGAGGGRGETPDLDAAYDYLICSWMGRNGVAGTSSYNRSFCPRYTSKGGHSAKRFAGVLESIPAWWERLRNVTILSRDAFALLEKIADEPKAAIYVDPPYVAKGAKYLYDFDPGMHAELARMVGRFRHARVVVSYYDHPTVRELYPADAWEWIECPTTKAMVNQAMRDAGGAVKAPEVLLCNRRTAQAS